MSNEYRNAGPLTQDLIWEQFPYPVALPTLLERNGPPMLHDATPATELKPPLAPRPDTWINQTDSTNGFSAYVAFVPAQRIAIGRLANRSFPIEDRVKTAYRIVESLNGKR